MPLNGKLSKNELLLPNIILFNQMFVEAQRIGGGRRTADVKTKLPNLQSTNESSKWILMVETFYCLYVELCDD